MKIFKNHQRPRRKYRFNIVGHKKAWKIWWDSPFNTECNTNKTMTNKLYGTYNHGLQQGEGLDFRIWKTKNIKESSKERAPVVFVNSHRTCTAPTLSAGRGHLILSCHWPACRLNPFLGTQAKPNVPFPIHVYRGLNVFTASHAPPIHNSRKTGQTVCKQMK